ncbi:IMP cyclohydrolase [Myxococcota bacterium]|nr:IMP cyclohydrolase [Myxococcota bacterium]
MSELKEFLRERAQASFSSRVENNPYPGRGLVLGRDESGDWLQIYWIMGRSENSRNRRFISEGGELRTEPVDPTTVEDPSLIIYRAMAEQGKQYLVTNGDQTDTLLEGIGRGETFEVSLGRREREPDEPNYTPRISGVIDLRGKAPSIFLGLLKANPADTSYTDRNFYRPASPPNGLGLALTTYEGDGSPLPSFSGDPLWFPTEAGPEQAIERYWGALDADNRVALAVKWIPASGGTSRLFLRNRY